MIKHFTLFIALFLFSFTATNAQPTITPAPGYKWVLVDTEYHVDKAEKIYSSAGCPIIQQQIDDNIGDGRNGGCGNSLGGQNFPASATMEYSFEVQTSEKPYPFDSVPENATSGTVFIPVGLSLQVQNPFMENQGFQLLAVGGESGNFSEFEFVKTSTTNLEIPSLNLADSSGEIIEASFRVKTENALKNQHHFYGNDFLFQRSKNRLIAHQEEQLFPIPGNSRKITSRFVLPIPLAPKGESALNREVIFLALPIRKNLGNLKINIRTTSSIAIRRISGDGDARIEYRQKEEPQVNLISEIQCWKILKIDTFTERENNIAKSTLSKNIVTKAVQITCFPNPATDQIMIKFSKKIKKGRVQIINNNGNVVYKSPVKNLNSGNPITVLLDDFAPGIYQFVLLDKAGKIEGATRFVVMGS